MDSENIIQGKLILKRLSMNTRLSAARIFDEESNDSVQSTEKTESSGKIRTKKKDVKASPYKNKSRKIKVDYETDPAVLVRRQKQIDYGKNTIGYDNYLKQIPKNKRGKDDPKTPEKHLKYSRRGWDGLIRTWRQKLHVYDPADLAENTKTEELDLDNSSLIEFI